MDPANDPVNHPAHYTQHPSGYECIDITRHMTYTMGNAVKYIWRCDLKNGVEDVQKAHWYVKDADGHSDRIFTSLDDRLDAQPKLDAVIATEPDPHKRLFYTAINDLDVEWALSVVITMMNREPVPSC